MKLNSSQKYYIHSIKPAVIIFYIVLLALAIVSMILNFVLSDSDSSFGGIAAASIIFLFIVGICTFFEEFKMFIQNGFTRNQLWKSFIIASIIIASVMSAIDLASLYILSFIISTKSLVMSLSSIYISNIILKVINTFFLQIVFYTLALLIGYFIRLIYYRMNKFGKITVSIFVPGFLFIALPLLSSYYNVIGSVFKAFFGFLETIMNPDKFYGLPMFYLFFVLLIVVVSLINKQLLKKATIK